VPDPLWIWIERFNWRCGGLQRDRSRRQASPDVRQQELRADTSLARLHAYALERVNTPLDP
jgi:hypothetical protein